MVLGLLAKSPGSGYDLAALADRSLAHFWPITRSQLYAELSRLEELGYAEATAVAQDRYPDKRVYRPTGAGLEALGAWLGTVGSERARTKNDYLMKIFLAAFMAPDRARAVLAEYRSRAERRRSELQAIDELLRSLESTASRRFSLATVRYGIIHAEAEIAWVDEAEELLAADLAGNGVGTGST